MSARGYLSTLSLPAAVLRAIAGLSDPSTDGELTDVSIRATAGAIALKLWGNNDGVQRAIAKVVDVLGAPILQLYNFGGLVVNDNLWTGYDSATQPAYKPGVLADIYGFLQQNGLVSYTFPGQVGNLMWWQDAIHENYQGDRALTTGSFGGWDGVFGTMTKVQDTNLLLPAGCVELDHFTTPTGYRGGVRFKATTTVSPQFAQVGGVFATPVPTGTELSFVVYLKRISGTAPGAQVYINWFTSIGGFISSSSAGSVYTLSTSTYNPISVQIPSGSVPGTAVYAQIICVLTSGVAVNAVVELCGAATKLGNDLTLCPPFVGNVNGHGGTSGGAAVGDLFQPRDATLPEMRCTTAGYPWEQRWTSTSTTVTPTTTTPWLTVDGTYVRLGVAGPRYRTTGYNSYVMRVAGGTSGQTMNAAQREAAMSQMQPGSLLRVWFYAPLSGTYTWAAVLAELDAIVASAKKYGHRLIAGLTDWWGHANDAYGAKTSTWFTSHQWRHSVYGADSYEDWVKTLAARYANEPTVAFYDLINEPQDAGAAFTTDLTLFATEVSGWIKALAPNVLCYIGINKPALVGGDTAYQTITASMDICSSHYYDSVGLLSSKSSYVANAITVGKPVMIDEFGVWASLFYGTTSDTDKDVNGLPKVDATGQARLIESELRTAFEIPNTFGAMLWSLMDSDTGSWYTGTAQYEPINQAEAHRIVRTISLPAGRGQLQDKISSCEGWLDAVQTWRVSKGTQIGGPNSGGTTPLFLYDRGSNNTIRQTTQANAPSAGRFLDATGTTRASLQFGGTHRVVTAWTTGSGSAHTLWAVVSPTVIPGAGTYGYILCPSTVTNGFSVRLNSSAFIELIRYGGSITVIGTGTTALAVGKLYIVEARYDASGGSWRIRVNENLDANGTTTTTFASDVAQIGSDSTGANGFQGHMLDVIKTNAFASTQDQARVYAYLLEKYPALG